MKYPGTATSSWVNDPPGMKRPRGMIETDSPGWKTNPRDDTRPHNHHENILNKHTKNMNKSWNKNERHDKTCVGCVGWRLRSETLIFLRKKHYCMMPGLEKDMQKATKTHQKTWKPWTQHDTVWKIMNGIVGAPVQKSHAFLRKWAFL